MTMNEIKPIAIEYFNQNIPDAAAREYFADAFDLWDGEDSAYDNKNNAYKAVINRYINPINEEVNRLRVSMSDGATRRTTAVNRGTSHETQSADKQSVGKSSTVRVEHDGEFKQSAYNYPDGYLTAPDAAYIKAETVDGEYDQRNTDETDNTAMDNTKSEKDGTNDSTGTTEEIDELARISILTYSPRLAKLIEDCVFQFVAHAITGRMTIGGCRAWH